MLAEMRQFSAVRCAHTSMYAALRSSKTSIFHLSLATVKTGSWILLSGACLMVKKAGQ